MVKPQNTPLEDFAKSLRNALRANNITQSEFASKFARIALIELNSAQQIVSGMIHGDIRRLTDRNVLLFFQVLAILDVFKEDTLEENLTVIENWYEDFCQAKGIDYMPVKDGVEGKVILQIIVDRQTEREHNKLLVAEKPKYTTSGGVPVIGRDKDIEEILRRLRNGERFIPIVGLPGVGKSELARQVREQGIFTSVLDPLSLVPGTTSDAVIMSLTSRLKRIPKQVNTLVTLEDCERINGLTPALDKFLNNHKHIHMLATSRKHMMSKKKDYSVEPLNEHEAIKLFLEIANINITEENTKYIVALCRYCGELPLAVNLVASSVDELGIEGLYNWFLERGLLKLPGTLTDSDSATSLNELFDECYRLLDEKAQRIIRRLGIFHWTGCSMKTAQAVCNLGDLQLNTDELYEVLQKLSRHFLITFLNKRVLIAYPFFQEYAWQKVSEDEKERLTRRYVDYFFTSFMDYFIQARINRVALENIFTYFGYNQPNTYGKEVIGDILEDVFQHIFYAVDYVEHLQFEYILNNLEKITETEEYHTIKRISDNFNNKSYDFTEEETREISHCYQKVVSRLIKEDSNFPYPQWEGDRYVISFNREGRKQLVGMRTPLADFMTGSTTRIVLMPENASRMRLIF